MVFLLSKALLLGEAAVLRAVESAFGVKLERAPLSAEGRLGFSDASCPVCFELARLVGGGKSPKGLAEVLAPLVFAELEKGGENFFSGCSALNGYVNFSFSNNFFRQAAFEAVLQAADFGKSSVGEGKTVVIDYSSPNVGKPLHIGHIRSTILGDSLKRLFAQCGYRVIGSNYLCEAGSQVAKLMLAVDLFGADEISDEKGLLDYYVRITAQIDADPSLKKQAEEILEKMENGDAGVAAGLKKVRDLSLPPVYENYKLLGVSFEEELFDSAFVEPSKKIVQEAVSKGVAFKDKTGETVADLEHKSLDAKLPNLVILRSNGTTLYSTRDLALADFHFEKNNFEHCIYVTASEQNLHFKQFFKILELLGRPYSSRLEHIGFGLIFLEGGEKMSSRKGNVLLLEDVISGAIEKAREEIKRKEEYSEKEIEEIAKEVGIAAVKFAILKVTAEKNINYSPQRATSFEGDSGAYLQYTYVRAQKILSKAQEEKIDWKSQMQKQGTPAPVSFEAYEKETLKLIANYPKIMESACKNRAPQQLCDYLLKTAAAFSAFYANCPVLSAPTIEEKQKRLAIVGATKTVLGNGLTLLGMSLPKKM